MTAAPAAFPALLVLAVPDTKGTVRQMLQLAGCSVVSVKFPTAGELPPDARGARLIVVNGAESNDREIQTLREVDAVRPSQASILFLSDNADAGAIDNVLNNGADDYAVKPLERDAFARKVKALLDAEATGNRGREDNRRRVNEAAAAAVKVVGYAAKQVLLECGFSVPTGAKISFFSPELNKAVELPISQKLTARVAACEPAGKNFRVTADILGQTFTLPKSQSAE